MKKETSKQTTNKQKNPGAGEDGGRRTGNEKLVIASWMTDIKPLSNLLRSYKIKSKLPYNSAVILLDNYSVDIRTFLHT